MKKKKKIPVIIFTYKRLKCLKLLINSLKRSAISTKKFNLYIFSDGPKNNKELNQINKVRDYIRSINFFNKKTIIFRTKNIGLANNIIKGISFVLKKYDRAIILEDDLVVAPNFLNYMYKCLEVFKDKKKIWHISGWSFKLNLSSNFGSEVYFLRQMSCWGWGTWRNRWKFFKKNPKELINQFSKKDIKKFNYNGLFNNWSQVLRNSNNFINTWAVFWSATIFKANGLCVYPVRSLTINKGNDSFSTNKKNYNSILKNYTFDNSSSSFQIKKVINKKYILDDFIVKKFKKNFFIKVLDKFL